jgi:hypothetical protein
MSHAHKLSPERKKNEIEVVLSGFSDRVALEKCGLLSGNLGQKAAALSVTPEQIREYVEENGYPEYLTTKTTPSTEDAIYIVKIKEGEYHRYSQERGIPSTPKIYTSYEEAIAGLADEMIDDYTSLRS